MKKGADAGEVMHI